MAAIKFGFAGAIVVGLGRLAATGRLPRNVLAGIRIPSTMRSEQSWRAGHEAAATALTAAGLGPIAIAVIVGAKQPGPDTQSLLFRIGTAWMVGWVGVATVQASRAARATELA